MSIHIPVKRPRDVTVCPKNPEAVIQGPEMGRVLWGYSDGRLGPLGKSGRIIREFKSMVEVATLESSLNYLGIPQAKECSHLRCQKGSTYARPPSL